MSLFWRNIDGGVSNDGDTSIRAYVTVHIYFTLHHQSYNYLGLSLPPNLTSRDYMHTIGYLQLASIHKVRILTMESDIT